MQDNASFNEQRRIMRRLEAVEGRFEELSIRITLPEVIGDPPLFQKLMREHSEMSEMAEFARGYRKLADEIEEARELLAAPEMAEMAREELDELEPLLEARTQEARRMLLPKDPDDYRNALVEIRAGAGGDEAGLFGAELMRMYTQYAQARGWKVELSEGGLTELGGVKEVVLLLQGKGVFSRLKYESGVHRVQRVPVTESGGRIHTSTVTVAVLPEAEEVEFELDPKDLKIDTFRSSGAGGQHINKTSSAIRITHLPTGTVVECQDERSQFKNKDKALRVLRSRLYEEKLREQTDRIASERKLQVGTGDRSERIRTYNYPQGRVSDHRIGLTLYKLDGFLSGDMDEMLDAILTYDQAEKLKAQGG